MALDDRFLRQCSICFSIPAVPKILPCQHIYCVECLDHYISSSKADRSNDDGDNLRCCQCRQLFVCLHQPEHGCEPVGAVHDEFIPEIFSSPIKYCSTIKSYKHKVMGLSVIDSLLYVVYHKQKDIVIYSATLPFNFVRLAHIENLVWPRGMTSSQKYHTLYVTDWSKLFSGRLWCITENVTQFKVIYDFDVQPFGISMNSSTDHVIVSCSTPIRHALPFASNLNRLLLFRAADNQLERTVYLDNSFEIPRHAVAIDDMFLICHGWLKTGRVNAVNQEGHQLAGVYGSHIAGGAQSLVRPLSMLSTTGGLILITDYGQHRIHVVTKQLLHVRLLISQQDDAHFRWPRQICVDANFIFVGMEDGSIFVFHIFD